MACGEAFTVFGESKSIGVPVFDDHVVDFVAGVDVPCADGVVPTGRGECFAIG